MSDDSLDHWIGRLNNGDIEAVDRIFRAYEPYLRIAVRRRLSPRLRSKVDSGDIVQSVFADVLRGIGDGRWRFAGRAQLLAFLRRLAYRRLADRYQKHGPSLEREEPLAETLSQGFPDRTQPRPSQVVQGRELWERILRACSPAHREVVRLRMNGFRMAEIASRTRMHEASVRRILYELARRLSIVRREPLAPPDETV